MNTTSYGNESAENRQNSAEKKLSDINSTCAKDQEMLPLILDKIQKNYHAVIEHPWQKYPENITAKETSSGKWFVLFMKIKGNLIGLPTSERIQIMNVKAEPDFINMICQTPGYAPAYHMNKEHWLTVRLDGSIPMETVMDLIRQSYEMLRDTPTRRIYEAVKKIPRGKVASYGRVAELAGNPRMSRAVGNALHNNPDPGHIPCYRVVNSKGELSGSFAFGGEKAQQKLLEADGIEVIDNRVDLKRYGI